MPTTSSRYRTTPTLDKSFLATGGGVDPSVQAIAVQPDGRILIAGSFTHYNGSFVKQLARLLPDGSRDPTFHPSGDGPSRSVSDIALQPNGKIFICGSFTTYDGVYRGNVARLHPDGSIDRTFLPTGQGADRPGPNTPHPEFASSVQTIAVQPDGRVLIGGYFGRYNGISRGNIARLNSDGSLDDSFPGTGHRR